MSSSSCKESAMVGRVPAEPGRPRVGAVVGTDVVPPMDPLGSTTTADGLAVMPPPEKSRLRVAAHDHRSTSICQPAGPWSGRAGPALGRRTDAEVVAGPRFRAHEVLVGVGKSIGPNRLPNTHQHLMSPEPRPSHDLGVGPAAQSWPGTSTPRPGRLAYTRRPMVMRRHAQPAFFWRRHHRQPVGRCGRAERVHRRHDVGADHSADTRPTRLSRNSPDHRALFAR